MASLIAWMNEKMAHGGARMGRVSLRLMRSIIFCLRMIGWALGFVIIGVVLVFAFLLDWYDTHQPRSMPMWVAQFHHLPYRQKWVPLDQIAPVLQRAVIASEDSRFCQHHGVDWTELAVVLADEAGPQRGASTLTMQLVRNLFLWPSRSYMRKMIEIPLALIVELVWSKRRILELYLNIAQWGDGLFGAEAAAQSYFGVAAAQLNQRQAIMMAASLPAPLLRHPQRPSLRQGRLAGRIKARIAAQKGLGCLFLSQNALRD